MKLQAVMENLHRQQRAKLLMEQQLAAAAQHAQVRAAGAGAADEPMGSPVSEAEQAQMAALAAMRAAAAGLQREDFEGEMEEDFDDEEALPTGHGAVAPGKGILLLPHRQLHPHSQPPKAPRPGADPEPRSAPPPPHAAHGHLGGGQDHGDWTYEEQFRQVGPLPVCVFSWSCYFTLTCPRTSPDSVCGSFSDDVIATSAGARKQLVPNLISLSSP
ncbi:hypothetical protein EYF80_062535 [Liparis tanakae]|uniref:AT-rich interactive domain-containing protein 3A n=1 Tax=Liparis tanakae TaxID=230148 RepID=A0A4Z2EFL3_9TELE|nr:hypothetical protein EYF80_062535 [Liparis tanakae]